MTTLATVIGRGAIGSRPAASSAGRLYFSTEPKTYRDNGSSWDDVSDAGAGGSGSITASGYTQNTARLLGRTTASSGAIEEITVGTGLSLSGGSLTATGGSSGALVLLEQHTASSSSSLDFTSFISGTYDDYLFRLINLVPATNTVSLYMRMGTGGGPTYDSGTNYGSVDWRWVPGGAAQSGASSGATQIVLTNYSATDTVINTGEPVTGRVELVDPGSSSAHKHVTAQTSWYNTGSVIEGSVVHGAYLSNTAVTAVRFLFSSGNIASGTIRVYGIAK